MSELKPEDAQFIESMEFSIKEIKKAFNIPEWAKLKAATFTAYLKSQRER